MSVLVGKKAPLFEVDAVINGNEIVEKFSLSKFIGRKHVVLFFYPMDFTFVCPAEIIAFQDKIKEFEDRNVAVVGCSVDSVHSHYAWLHTDRNKGGIKGVTYPLLSDFSKSVSANFDVLAGDFEYDEDGQMEFEGEPAAYRGLFLIDMQGIVRHQVVNDMSLGCSVDEVLRMVDALQFHEDNGEVSLADWHKGNKGVDPSH